MSATTTTMPYKSRRQRPKIEKSNEEFKQHESILMGKRNTEVNNSVTKKCHVIWNQYLFNKPKPNTLRFNFTYHNLDKYLAVCDNYEPSQHKDPKQKWWNNQKASEMSQGFLPSVLNATDQMAEYLGQQMDDALNPEFAYYCQFELLETAITSVFSTMRSGSNEVFLRTSFQYSKANLRKKLVSYFTDQELRIYDLKARKKKDLWCKLIKEKKDRLLMAFQRKKAMVYGQTGHDQKPPNSNMSMMNMDINQHHAQNMQNGNVFIKQQPDDQYYNHHNQGSMNHHRSHSMSQSRPDLPPMINFPSGNSSNSDSVSCTTSSSNNHGQSRLQLMNNDSSNTANTSSTVHSANPANNNPPPLPPINWNELNQSQPSYQPYQTLKITPYSQPQTIQLIPSQTRTMNNMQTMGYGSHRECQDCLSYMSKMQQLLQVNQKLHDENLELKQLRHQYVADRQELSNKYNNLLIQMNNLQRNAGNNGNDNGSGMQIVGHQMPQNNMNDDTWMTMPSAHDNNGQNQSSPHSHNSHNSHPSQHGDNNGNSNNNMNNNMNNGGISAYAQSNHNQY